jgi:hypothetical protein
MSSRWKRRPIGSNWGQFGPDDELGRLNYLTPEAANVPPVMSTRGSHFA